MGLRFDGLKDLTQNVSIGRAMSDMGQGRLWPAGGGTADLPPAPEISVRS